MRYCPNPSCPYRVERGEPAEYRDHLVRCGDCGEELVDSRAEALRRKPRKGAREAAAPRTPMPSVATKPQPDAFFKRNDTTVGLTLILGGGALTAVTYALAPGNGGRYILFIGPMLYGFYRLFFRPRGR
jgi:hypothetical protein